MEWVQVETSTWFQSDRGINDGATLTRPSGTLSHRMGEGRGEGASVVYLTHS